MGHPKLSRVRGHPKSRCVSFPGGFGGVLSTPGCPEELLGGGGRGGSPGLPKGGGDPTDVIWIQRLTRVSAFHWFSDLSIKLLWQIKGCVLGGSRLRGSYPSLRACQSNNGWAAGWACAHWLFMLSIRDLPCYWLFSAVSHLGAPRPLAELPLHHAPHCSPHLPINLYPTADWPSLHYLTFHWPNLQQTHPRLVQTPSLAGPYRAVPGGGRWRRERVGAAAAPGPVSAGGAGPGRGRSGATGAGEKPSLSLPGTPSLSSRRAGGPSGSGARSGAGPAFGTRLPRERPEGGPGRGVPPGVSPSPRGGGFGVILGVPGMFPGFPTRGAGLGACVKPSWF